MVKRMNSDQLQHQNLYFLLRVKKNKINMNCFCMTGVMDSCVICCCVSVVLSRLMGSRALLQMESRLNTVSAEIRDITTAEQGFVTAQVCVCVCVCVCVRERDRDARVYKSVLVTPASDE